jgi:hypothetical protein
MKSIFLGHHKCASTFARAVVTGIAQRCGREVHREDLSTRLPLGYERDPLQRARIEAAYASLRATGCTVVCHGNADMRVVETLAEAGPFRAFHLIRDPRDLLVSGYFWHRSSASRPTHDRSPWNQARRERLRAAPDVAAGLLLDMDLSCCYFEALAEWDFARSDVLECRYEDMILDPLAFFARALRFVGLEGVEQAVLAQQVEQHGFRQAAGGRAPGEERLDHKYRMGIAGDWRRHFTPAVTEGFKRRYGDLLIRLGYERDAAWEAAAPASCCAAAPGACS